MADTEQNLKKEVKIEELLRLKRAERPSETFWNDFDRELHQRMLQTLVKKDPWYIQLLRGVTGRIAQTSAVGAAAVLLAFVAVRPVIVDSVESPKGAMLAEANIVDESAASPASSASPVVVEELAFEAINDDLSPDYGMAAISGIADSDAASEMTYTSEYSHDSFEVASYDRSAYVADAASSFAGAGLATGLIY